MTTITALEAALPLMTDSNRSFANSLISQSRTRTLSDKQMHWVERLVREAGKPQAERATADVGNLSGIIALFDKAKQHLKYPAIVLSVPAAGCAVRINVAGTSAKQPGSLNVCSADKTEENGTRRAWYGRVQLDGKYVGSQAAGEMFTAITDRLKAFADAPAKIAAEHGKLTGYCCFCSIRLTDKRSTSVGYGKICAGHYGLPWGQPSLPVDVGTVSEYGLTQKLSRPVRCF